MLGGYNVQFDVSLAMDAAFRPAISYTVGAPYPGQTSVIGARGWDGTSWQRLGADPSVPFGSPQLAQSLLRFDRHGEAVITAKWATPIFVLRRSGSAWQPLASGVFTAPFSLAGTAYSIGFDAANAPWLVAQAGSPGGVDLQPAMAFDANGVPTVAWASTVTGNNEILVARGASVASGAAGPAWPPPAPPTTTSATT